MRKLKIMEHISLDGVIQAPGGRNEDEDGGFAHGGWTTPFSDTVIREAIFAEHDRKLDLLLGRRTYDSWAQYWPKVEDGVIANAFNAATKYVATHRPDNLEWTPASDLGEDIVEGIRRIKSTDGPDLLLWGSSSLTSVLFQHGLVDEVVLIVYPVLLGKGKRFFSDGTDPRELVLVNTIAAASGILMNTYRYAGALRS